MRISIICLLLTVVGFITGTAQSSAENLIFKTDFNNSNEVYFPVGDNETQKAFVKNDLYHMVVKDSTKNYRVIYKVPLNPHEEFVVEGSFKHVEGQRNKLFGMAFGYKDIDNGFYFAVKETGYCEIYKNENGKRITLSSVQKPAIVRAATFNKLTIHRLNDKLLFSVNDQTVSALSYSLFPDSKFGIFVAGRQEVACSYFKIKQKREPLNLVEDWNKFSQPVKLGQNINSAAGEMMPIVSADDKYLFVTRKDYTIKDGKDNVFFAHALNDSVWSNLEPIGKPINNAGHNFVCGISADNNQLLLGGKYKETGEAGGAGFSRTFRTANGWEIPKNLNIKNYYNDDKYVEMSPSPDFKVIVFSVKRNDGFGSRDLYFSKMLADSSWSEPVNLGADVNTFGEECSPFLAPDNETMYFSSDGWTGYGSNDIFITKRLDDSWTKWSKPKNMGPHVNGDKWDAYYTTSASGKYAYLVRNISDEAHADIYRIKQPTAAKPQPMLMVKGKVLNSKTKAAIPATVICSPPEGDQKHHKSVNTDEKGAFTLLLPKGQKYFFSAHKVGFISEHKNSDIIDLQNYREEEIELLLTPFEKGESVIMHNLFFTANKFDILPESETELNRLYQLLRDNKKMKVEIGGHTSINKSGDKWNLDLSTNRARAVKDYLVGKGIAEARISVKGYGNSKPLNKIMQEKQQEKNRRVEFTILEL